MSKTNNKKHYLGTAFLIFIFAASVIWCLSFGIMNLIGAGEAELCADAPRRTHVSGKVIFASKVCEYSHTLNGLIPLGTEHYYLVLDENGEDYCLVRAKESWYETYFDSNGFPSQGEEIEIYGIVTAVAPGLKSTFDKFNAENAEAGIEINPEKYVDMMGYSLAWESIITGILFVAGVLVVVWQMRAAEKNQTLVKAGMWTVLIAALMLARFLIYS